VASNNISEIWRRQSIMAKVSMLAENVINKMAKANVSNIVFSNVIGG
jgi:hypothetical protein